MKKIIFAVLLMITSITAFSQDKKVLHNQFSDYVQFKKDHQKPEFNRHHRPEFGPQHFPMQPRPLSVTVKGDKVIVIFKKEDYNKLRPMVNQRIMWKERPRGKVQEMLIEKLEH
jgi:hypothetical protein